MKTISIRDIAQKILPAVAVAAKDLRSEIRTRYAIAALLLFVIAAVSMIVFSAAGEKLTPELAAGILWVIMFFGSMSGLSRSFVAEEERGTSLLLAISASYESIYIGKLFVTVILSFAINITASGLFLTFSDDISIKNTSLFFLILLFGSISISASVTILSAIIAKTGARAALLPALSFPVLLPVMLAGIHSTVICFSSVEYKDALPDLQMMAGYSGVVISISYLLFGFIWRE